MDPPTHFSIEGTKADGSISFLDTLVLPQSHNSVITSVYRNSPNTDIYLQWDSHHHLAAMFSVTNTLKHRAKTVCLNNQLLKEESIHLRQALMRCK